MRLSLRLLVTLLLSVYARPVSAASTTAEIEAEILALYQKHNPAKVSGIPGLMSKYSGSEEALLQTIRDKYGVEAGAPGRSTDDKKPAATKVTRSGDADVTPQWRRITDAIKATIPTKYNPAWVGPRATGGLPPRFTNGNFCNIPRYPASSFTAERFRTEFEGRKPFILTGAHRPLRVVQHQMVEAGVHLTCICERRRHERLAR